MSPVPLSTVEQKLIYIPVTCLISCAISLSGYFIPGRKGIISTLVNCANIIKKYMFCQLEAQRNNDVDMIILQLQTAALQKRNLQLKQLDPKKVL
jgi:hypothetical protein